MATESYELTEQEFRQILEDRIRRYFSMSLDEFVKAMDAGRLPNVAAAEEIALLIGPRAR